MTLIVYNLVKMTTESPSAAETTGKSVKIEESEQPSKEFLKIFEQLDPNINGELIEKAWKQYDTISQQVNIDLEVYNFKVYFNSFLALKKGLDGMRVLYDSLDFDSNWSGDGLQIFDIQTTIHL